MDREMFIADKLAREGGEYSSYLTQRNVAEKHNAICFHKVRGFAAAELSEWQKLMGENFADLLLQKSLQMQLTSSLVQITYLRATGLCFKRKCQ
jgi:hypothetical protein